MDAQERFRRQSETYSASPKQHRIAGPLLTVVGKEREWQPVEAIIGNPPFLGGRRLKPELGNSYIERLRNVYNDRLPEGADLFVIGS